MKLGKRLRKIEQLVSTDYDHIWDCCCDHGFLGASLLSRLDATEIHFVDIVPSLIEKVEKQLSQFYSESSSQWQTHCIDVAKLPLTDFPGKHLIIIAGVGGDLMITFIEALVGRHPELNLDFILCPVHHLFALRDKLIALNFSLKDEALLAENRRFYEVLFVSTVTDPNRHIHCIGEKIWQTKTEEQTAVAKRYLTKTLNHYRKSQQGGSNVDDIIEAYNKVSFKN